MKCKEAVCEIIPFYCGELDEGREKEYKRHTAICKDCARFSFKIRKAVKYLKENKPVNLRIDLSFEIK
ncbi:MAG: hypothetical protein FWG57_03210 [Endomicrobia bacterium]|nr:hypothetical protein [Endomicrobiia bacterium]